MLRSLTDLWSRMPEGSSYRFDRFIVDLRSACLRRDGIVVPLRPKSFDVLVHLVRNPGRLVAKGELIDSVWQNVIVTENSLAQCIREIREALGDNTQSVIETVAKRGYLFAPSVIVDGAAASGRAVPCRCPTDRRSRCCHSTI